MRKSAPLYDPRIPRGCDQQGRYPEAAEACTEIGHEDGYEDKEWSWVPLIVYLTLAASIAAVLLIGV
tara:strand:+ start:401 stop:601 length:201 start_codon:yes stop_codon:yes gene_type:complete